MREMLTTIWQIAIPYFRSEDKIAGRALLAAVIALELGYVGLTVALNKWQNSFYNALQEKNWDDFVFLMLVFSGIAASIILILVLQTYLQQWLQIRWRRWLTNHYLGEWLSKHNHYRMQLTGDAADNPDQRIADDTQLFVDRTLQIGIGLLNSIVTLLSFLAILWGLSNAAPLTMFGEAYNIPGYLVWAALIYAVIGTGLTHLIGNPLVNLNFMQQRFEADFRFNLVRTRENSEQIALLQGENVEQRRLSDRFGRVVTNWYGIMTRTKWLTLFTASYSQISVVFPYLMVAPAYFAGAIPLGGMMQTASAFSSVQGALSFFVTAYRQLAEWRSVVARLDGFEASVAQARALPQKPGTVALARQTTEQGITLDQIAVNLPDGKPVIGADHIVFQRGERTLITGPSGAGKSTLFRAIAGVWPFGSGRVSVPVKATVMTLPQRPYFPVGSLKAAVAYPAEDGAFTDEQLRKTLNDVGLPALAARLSEDGHWNRTLSLGEQQRLGVARALLHAPDYLFLDEATASLDEAAEAALYGLIEQRLPETAIVSIGHRSTLAAFHSRTMAVSAGDGRAVLRDEATAHAAS